MSAERKKLEQQLDNLVRAIVRKRDKCCVLCGPQGMECDPSHYIPREKRLYRWDLKNVHLMCIPCHRAWHDHQKGYHEFMVYKYGGNEVVTMHRKSKKSYKWPIEALEVLKHELELQLEAT